MVRLFSCKKFDCQENNLKTYLGEWKDERMEANLLTSLHTFMLGDEFMVMRMP